MSAADQSNNRMADGEPEYKRALNICRRELVADMDFDSIRDVLISKEALPDTKLRDIKEEKYTTEKNRKLIEAISATGEHVYRVFRTGLKTTKQSHLYDLLTQTEKELLKETTTSSTKGRTSDISSKFDEYTEEQTERNISNDRVQDIDPMTQTSKRPGTTDETKKSSSRQVDKTADVPDGGQLSSNFSQFSKSEVKSSNVADGPTFVSAGTESSGQAEHQERSRPEEQPISLGNFTSMKDIHESNMIQAMPSTVKQRHFNPDEPSQLQAPAEKLRNGSSKSTESGKGQQDTAGQDTHLYIHNTVDTDAHQNGRTAAGSDVASPQADALPIPSNISTANAAREHFTETQSIEHMLSRVDTSDARAEHEYLTDHFDACVIYTENYRNRAEEVVSFIEGLPGDFKVCLFDDEEHFGLFAPERHPKVITSHCFLQLVIIADNVEEDKHASYLQNTVSMELKNSAQVRPILFQKNEEKFIPTSLSNTKFIPWYNKDKEYVKENMLKLLKQSKSFRKQKEEKKIKTKKDVHH